MSAMLSIQQVARPALATAILLLVPLVAMQCTPEVKWTPLDFGVAGTLLFGTGLAYEWLASRGRNLAHKLGAAAALGTGLLLGWVNLAVGLIGSENNPLNLLYLGVLAVALGGALLARFQPRGLVRALGATALTQALVTVLVLLAGPAVTDESFAPGQVLGVNAFFVALWLGAALLFWWASATRPATGQQATSKH